MIRYYLPFRWLRERRRLSEREVAEASSLSRGAVRQLASPAEGNPTMTSLAQLAEYFERDVEVLLAPTEIFSEYSTIAVAMKIERDGFDSWKTHILEFVDEFRRTADARLVLLPPPSTSDRRIIALLASVVRSLCDELCIGAPQWAMRRYFLSTPWFVSGSNALKASALLESSLPFRANNIFVLDNFLGRA